MRLAILLAAAATAQRVEVPFSYNWRSKWTFARDGPEGIPGPYGFSQNVAPYSGYWTLLPTGATCTGTIEQNPNRFNASDCATSCAYSRECLMWQEDEDRRHCIHGFEGYSCTDTGKGPAVTGTRTKAMAEAPIKLDYPWASPSFDDSSWDVVSAPHDAIISAGDFSPGADSHHGYLERNGTAWYRKTFTPPAEWKGRVVYVRFEGVFHFVTVWLNGEALVSRGNAEGGYSEFTVRLDNASTPFFGAECVLALRVDPSYGSGHWYEGGGLYRDVQLVAVQPVHVVEDGLYVVSEVDVTAAASIPVQLELENLAASGAADVTVDFTLEPLGGGAPIASATASLPVPASANGSTVTASRSLSVAAGALRAWSVSRGPSLYTVRAAVSVGGAAVDEASSTVGFRTTAATVSSKYVLNGQSFELRGFSHHNSFLAAGVAMPARLDLFRAQQAKAMGANFWRNSHNPYRRTTYDILDRIGMVVWDEHRDYGQRYVSGVYSMVKRSRNHPGVIMWSFCNEFECGCGTNETGGLFRAACKSLDPQRPTAANGNPNGGGIDIQGHSHSSNSTFISFHNQQPAVPQILSECCSCESQRLPAEARTLPTCIADQNSPGLLPFVLGSTGVWTAFDYIGESHEWPNVWSSYGQFSLAGFPKPHAFWYRTNWLARRPAGDPGRPMQPELHFTRVLDLPDQLTGSPTGFAVRAVTDSPVAELFVDGVSQGKQATGVPYPAESAVLTWSVNSSSPAQCYFPVNGTMDQCRGLEQRKGVTSPDACRAACCASSGCNTWQYASDGGCWVGYADASKCYPGKQTWVGGQRDLSPSTARNLTVVGLSGESGAVQSSQVALGPGAPARVTASLDSPNPASGTGAALVLDGSDVALVRLAIEDAAGRLVSAATTNVSLTVLSGPGRVVGVGSGDPACHCHPHGDTCAVYGGLGRGLVQVTADCMTPNRALLRTISRDAGLHTTIAGTGTGVPCPSGPIVVRASAVINGTTVTSDLSIAVSDEEADSPLAVALATAEANDDVGAWLADFQG